MSDPTTTLPQLADPRGYAACRWDLTQMPEKRAYWLALFRTHFPTLLLQAVRVMEHDGVPAAEAQRRCDAAEADFMRYLDEVTAEPARYGRLDILEVCYERERVLRRAGIDDPYRLAKARENKVAMALLPQLLRELDAMPDGDRDLAIMHGVFAGNIFDLGATDTEKFFRDQSVDFRAVRSRLKSRPWLVDDLDAWLDRLNSRTYRAAVLFVDNAGPDIVLGMLPLARDLVRRGTRVVLAANTTPTLNDITHAELLELLGLARAADRIIDDAMRTGRLVALADGNGAPLIDLSRLDPAFVEAVRVDPIDLVVLEGMGRAIESNFDARFACDALKVAMIKDKGVADAMGGELYDLVCRFEPR